MKGNRSRVQFLRKVSILKSALLTTSLVVLGTTSAFGQGAASGNLLLTLLVLALVLLLMVVLLVSNSLLQLSGGKRKLSLFPSKQEFVGSSAGASAGKNVTKLKKGFDLQMSGEASKSTLNLGSSTYSITPKDFQGLAPIPKLTVEVGDEVKAGDALFYDKRNPEMLFTSPVSGEVVEVNRGAKRSIADVVVLADKDQKYRSFDVRENPSTQAIRELLLKSGAWAFLRQRPFNVVADHTIKPKAIFISCFDTAPLAPDLNYTLNYEAENFQAGIKALSLLTDGAIHLGLRGDVENSETFEAAVGAEKHYFTGPHPAGNVGTQIHHIDPINKGEVVWTIKPEDVVTIGRLATEGIYKPERTVALTGAELNEARYIKTLQGASLDVMLDGNLKNDHVRVISGDVLTGKTGTKYLGFFDNQVTVIEEGDKHEFLGWILPSYPRPSKSPTFVTSIAPFLFDEVKVNSNAHGEPRAMVVTGQYEEVMPMDIYPQHLLKAIITNDFDGMEGLGIYEVVEEDLALCEFVCTSKTDVTKILREGLETVREQG